MNFELQHAKNGLIIGGGHGIGYALTELILTQVPAIHLAVSYHDREHAGPLLNAAKTHTNRLQCYQIDTNEEDNIKQQIALIEDQLAGESLDFCIICTGILHNGTLQPEKSLLDVNQKQLMQYFQVNSCVTPLIAKYCKGLFSRQNPSLFVSLSAKVGSIQDNALGGWYGYRASKAALNMFIKNIAIEYQRDHLKTIVMSIHPGTTRTSLSDPFLKNIQHQIFSPEETAAHILNIITHCDRGQHGKFKNWDGKDIPW